MFVYLLVVTFVVATITSGIVAAVFGKSVRQIMARIVAEDLSAIWSRYLTFAIYVVGISGGVRIWDLERYILPGADDKAPLVLNSDRWTLEIYRTVIGTLQGLAWMLLVFFLFALVAYVVVRGREMKAKVEPRDG